MSEDYLDILRANIRRRGWTVQYVEDQRRPFAYTIGLHERGLSELLVTGVAPERALLLPTTMAEYSVNKVQPRAGEIMTLPDTVIEFVRVSQPDAHMGFAVALYGPEVQALQAVWCDDRGHSPWCPGFDEGRGTQPVLGMRHPVHVD